MGALRENGREKRPGKTGLTTLNRLRCFQMVVEEGGFKRATLRLHITQPALSYQIKHLEEEMGALLFDRRPGGVSLTAAGRLLFAHAQRVNGAVQEAQRAVKDISAGEVRIGTVNSIGTYFVPHLLASLRERCAAARPVLYRESDEFIEAMLASRIDLAILANPRVDKRLRYEKLFEENVSLVAARSHPLFGATQVRPAQLEGARIIALSEQTPTGLLIHRYLDRLGVTVEPVVLSESVEMIKRMVEIGMGAAFLPDMVTERDVIGANNRRGVLSRTTLDPPLVRQIVLVTWNEAPSSRAVETCIEEIRRQSRNWPGAAAPRAP